MIGIDHYSGAPSLCGAVKDAIGFHDWLRDKDGGGLMPDCTWLVQSQPEPIAPLQDEVDQALREIETAAAARGGRRLYFHFSGHGAGSPVSEDVALLLAKWERSLSQFALSCNGYHGELHRAGLFEEIVFSLDCCRTPAERAIGSAPSFALQAHRTPPTTRKFIAYATENGAQAFETRQGELWHGTFTRCLLASLRGSPYGITAAKLKAELESSLQECGQRPHIVNGLLPDSRFGCRGASPNLVVEIDQARGNVRLLDGKLEVVAHFELSERPDATPPPVGRTWELSIEPGLYMLEDDAGHTNIFNHGGRAVTRVVF